MKVFNPTEEEKEAMFANMQTSIKRQEQIAVPQQNYSSDASNLRHLFTKEWQVNENVNKILSDYAGTDLWYFSSNKDGNLYEIFEYHTSKQCAIQIIYELNMPADTWSFIEWFYQIVSIDFLSEKLPKMPTYKNEGTIKFVSKYGLLPEIYKLWKNETK